MKAVCCSCGRPWDVGHDCKSSDATVIRDLKISLENAKTQIVTQKATIAIQDKTITLLQNNIEELRSDIVMAIEKSWDYEGYACRYCEEFDSPPYQHSKECLVTRYGVK